MSEQTDVVVLGGGLAGLSLAIQLRQRDPSIAVTVLERRTHPVREAAFKVGESTVEIGAHYFAHVLGLREHLETQQLRKFGFRFFFSEGREDLDQCTELGVSELLPTPSWQLDRGRFENFLGEQAHRPEGPPRIETRKGHDEEHPLVAGGLPEPLEIVPHLVGRAHERPPVGEVLAELPQA